MARHRRRKNRILKDSLYAEGFNFDFYQAVRLLEMLYPDKIPVGESADADREPVRFHSSVSFEYPASAIYEINPADLSHLKKKGRKDAASEEEAALKKPDNMTVNFMGLAGCLGPLPAPYTELILERSSKRDTALKDFLDIFNHRLVSLMYRVRKMYRIGFAYADKTGRSPEKSHFSRIFYSLMGMGTGGLKDRMQVNDRALLYYTALLAQQPPSITALETILSDYFQVKVKGDQLIGGWYVLADDQITEVGISGKNNRLGETVVVGSRVWDQQGKFDLHIGPLTLNEFLDFLPGGTAYVSLCQLTRFYVCTDFDFSLLLILKPEEVPGTRLGKTDGSKLGWTSWLRAGPFHQDYGRVKIKNLT